MKWKWQRLSTPRNQKRFRQLAIAALCTYIIAIIAPILPSEMLIIHGQSFKLQLINQYSGLAVWGVLVGFGMLQAWFYFRKNIWMLWPGFLAGLHTFTFAALRMYHLWLQGSGNYTKSLAYTEKLAAYPLIGLYIMLIAGLCLLLFNILQLANTVAKRQL